MFSHGQRICFHSGVVVRRHQRICFPVQGFSSSSSSSRRRRTEEGHFSIRKQSKLKRYVLPKRVILVRHGESEGNIDESVYTHRGDPLVHLTRRGWLQSLAAGRVLREEYISDHDQVHMVVSPYVRTMETARGIMSAWDEELRESMFHVVEEPRIREQDFGNFQDAQFMEQCFEERARFGHFWYRFLQGESGADVYDRASSFLESLFRRWMAGSIDTTLIVSHGITIRVLLMRYFKWSVSEFEQKDNLRNAEFVVLERVDGRLHLREAVSVHDYENGTSQTVSRVEGGLRLKDSLPRRRYIRTVEEGLELPDIPPSGVNRVDSGVNN